MRNEGNYYKVNEKEEIKQSFIKLKGNINHDQTSVPT
jgi:hypothetical protein